MPVLTANKLIQPSGAPSLGKQPMVSTSWGVDGGGILNNGTIGLPIVPGTIGYAVVQGAAGQWEYAAFPAGVPGGVDTEFQYNDGGALNGAPAMVYEKATGKVTLNANAGADGDLEVLAETTGVAARVDVAEKNLYVGFAGPTPYGTSGRGVVVNSPAGFFSLLAMHHEDADAQDAFVGGFYASSGGVSGASGIIGQVFFKLDGSTAGNRGAEYSIRLKDDGAATITDRLVIDEPGHTILNSRGVATPYGTSGIGLTVVSHSSNFTLLGIRHTSVDSDAGLVGGTFYSSDAITGNNGIVAQTLVNLDGATAGNRGAKYVIRTKENGNSNINAHFSVDQAGVVTVNESAEATADFRVLSEAAGTTMFADVSLVRVGIGNANPSSTLDVSGDVEIGSTDSYYIGDPTTDGTWRFIRSGDDLLIQQREAGTYNTKSTISGA